MYTTIFVLSNVPLQIETHPLVLMLLTHQNSNSLPTFFPEHFNGGDAVEVKKKGNCR